MVEFLGTSSTNLRSISVISRFPGNPINWDLLVEFYWNTPDLPSGMLIKSEGEFNQILSSTESIINLISEGIIASLKVWTGNDSTITLISKSDMYVGATETNWVCWSKIGNFDFTHDHSNEAGERPLEWKGLIYDILKMSKSVVVYGRNGISILKPYENIWSEKRISLFGTKGKGSQVGFDGNHWFINTLGELWHLGESLTKIGFQEFLFPLSDPIMTLNKKDKVIYICDGSNGYIYSYETMDLATYNNNVTGFNHQDDISYFCSSSALTPLAIFFKSAIYDFGSKNGKTIYNIEFHVETTSDIDAAIDYRNFYGESFQRTPWIQIDPRGMVYLPCFGREFQFLFRSNAPVDEIMIDSIRIDGEFHNV